MELPSVDEVRKRIMTVEEQKIRYCLMAVYLFAGRISEVVLDFNPTTITTPACLHSYLHSYTYLYLYLHTTHTHTLRV
jgi:hypothetical protein